MNQSSGNRTSDTNNSTLYVVVTKPFTLIKENIVDNMLSLISRSLYLSSSPASNASRRAISSSVSNSVASLKGQDFMCIDQLRYVDFPTCVC
jgi:hypothetical protein